MLWPHLSVGRGTKPKKIISFLSPPTLPRFLIYISLLLDLFNLGELPPAGDLADLVLLRLGRSVRTSARHHGGHHVLVRGLLLLFLLLGCLVGSSGGSFLRLGRSLRDGGGGSGGLVDLHGGRFGGGRGNRRGRGRYRGCCRSGIGSGTTRGSVVGIIVVAGGVAALPGEQVLVALGAAVSGGVASLQEQYWWRKEDLSVRISADTGAFMAKKKGE